MLTFLFNFLKLFTPQALADNVVRLLAPLGPPTGAPVTTMASTENYIATAFPLFLAVAVALAVVMIAWGGLQHMLSKVPGSKQDGKEKISNAIWGLLLALAAWLILYTINPQILNTPLLPQ
ncbi:MAG: hypothetical protein AAB364_02940 [Patescibacteria group bacterium]